MPHYASHTAFLNSLSPTIPDRFAFDSCSSAKGSADFHGAGTWSQVHAAAPLGSSALAAQMRPLPTVHPVAQRRRPAYGVAGGAPSVPRHLAGSPCCMRTMRTTATTPRTVRIAHCSYLGGWSKQHHAVNRGLALLEIIDALERSAVRVELVVYKASVKPDDDPIVSVTVKGPGDHYDADLLAFILADSRWHRRLMFRSMEQHCPNQCGSGYGEWEPIPGTWDWITPRMDPTKCASPAEARTWMITSAATLLGTITP